jgi:hypothetical protein
MAAAATSTDYVWIKLATAKEDAFAFVAGSRLVGQVASLACATLAWGLKANKVRIHMVAESGTAEPTPAAVDEALAQEPLAVSAVVGSGAWLVAAPTAPGSPGGGGGGGAGALQPLERAASPSPDAHPHLLLHVHYTHPQTLFCPSCLGCRWPSLSSAGWRPRCALFKCSAGMPPSPQ